MRDNKIVTGKVDQAIRVYLNETAIDRHKRWAGSISRFQKQWHLVLLSWGEVMPIKKIKTNTNGSLPTAKDFPPPKKLTSAQKRLREATREFVKALDKRIKKYGEPSDFRH